MPLSYRLQEQKRKKDREEYNKQMRQMAADIARGKTTASSQSSSSSQTTNSPTTAQKSPQTDRTTSQSGSQSSSYNDKFYHAAGRKYTNKRRVEKTTTPGSSGRGKTTPTNSRYTNKPKHRIDDEVKTDRASLVVGGAAKQWAGGHVASLGTSAQDTLVNVNSIRGAKQEAEAGYNYRSREEAEKREAEKENKISTKDGVNLRTMERKYDLTPGANDSEAYRNIVGGTQKLISKGDELIESGGKDIEQAKEGLGALGRLGVDLSANALQMMGDRALSFVPVVGQALAMGSLMNRAGGTAAYEARQLGLNADQQYQYALGTSLIEGLSEGIFNSVGAFRATYGKGALSIADNLSFKTAAKNIVQNVLKSDTGKAVAYNLARLGGGALEEGIEEVVADLAEPALKYMIMKSSDPNAEYDPTSLKDLGYDFLVGALMGGVPGSVDMVRGVKADVNLANSEAYKAFEDGNAHAQQYMDRAMVQGRVKGNGRILKTDAEVLAEKMQKQIDAGGQILPGQTRRLMEALDEAYETNKTSFKEKRARNYQEAAKRGETGNVVSSGSRAENAEYANVSYEKEIEYADQARELMGDNAKDESVEAVGRVLASTADSADVDTVLMDPDAKAALERLAPELQDTNLSAKNAEAREEIENVISSREIATRDSRLQEAQDRYAKNIESSLGNMRQDAKKLLSDNYQTAVSTMGEGSGGIYKELFNRIYIDGTIKGADFEKTYDNIIANNDSTIQEAFPKEFAKKIFDQGRMANVATVAKETAQAKAAKYAEKHEIGAYIEEDAKQYVDDKTFEDIKKFAKRSKLRVEIVKHIVAKDDDGNILYDENGKELRANGQYKDGVIYIAADSDNKLITIAKHELTHHIKEISPERYQELEDFVFQRWYNSDFQAMQDAIVRYQKLYQNITPQQAKEEIIADASEAFFTDEGAIQDVCTFSGKLAKALSDGVHTLLDTFLAIQNSDRKSRGFGGQFLKQLNILKDAERMWAEALDESVNTDRAAKNGAEAFETKEVRADDYADASTQFTTSDVKHSLVRDKDEIRRLNSEPSQKTYRSMVLIDGKLYPPMSSKVRDKNGNWVLNNPLEVGQWIEADITTDPKMFTKEGTYKLKKDNNKDVNAAYNPYIHSSKTMLNDQFKEAYKRPNLVVVEGEIPTSELNSGYRAEHDLDDGRHVKAKDTTGILQWKAGDVQRQLTGTRTVYLTNHFKLTRIVPDSEVAQHIKSMLSGTDITVPYNVVTPNLRKELLKVGVKMEQNEDPKYYVDLGTAKYSIGTVIGASGKNYGKGVILDSNLLTGLNDAERIGITKEYVKELAGKVFTAYDHNGVATDVEIVSGKKYRNNIGKRISANRDLKTKHIDRVLKQESIALIDELITTSTYDSKSAARHPHGWLDNKGQNDWEKWTVYLQEKNSATWQATLHVAIGNDGKRRLYDIDPIKKVEGAGKSATPSTTKSVPQASTKSNTQNGSYSLSYSQDEMDAHRAELENDAEANYGEKYTDDFNEAGYVFPNGKMLKMGMYGSRGDDHAMASLAYDDIGYDTYYSPKAEAQKRFINEGNIRYMPENGWLNLGTEIEPTDEQYAWIRRAVNSSDEGITRIEFTNMEDNTVDHKDYDRWASASDIINDIKRFYSTGKIGGSELSRFRYSLSSSFEAVGCDIRMEDGLIKAFKADGTEIKEFKPSDIRKSPLGRLLTLASTDTSKRSKILSGDDVNNQIAFLTRLYNMILNTQDPDLIWAVSGTIGYDPKHALGNTSWLKEAKSKFASITGNADPQYKTTIDFTTICVKTQAVIDAMSKVMIDLGRGLTEHEIIDIVYRETAMAGEQVPCPVCYVFSRWVGLGNLFGKIKQFQQDYPENMDMTAVRKEYESIKKEVDKLVKQQTGKKSGSKARDKLYADTIERKDLLDLKKQMPNKGLTAAEEKELEDINRRLDILDHWSWLEKTRLADDYKAVPDDVLFDLNAGRAFATDYPATWRFRTTRGPALGKAVAPYSPSRLGDTIRGIASPSTLNKLGNSKRVFLNQNGLTTTAKKAYEKAITNAKRQNRMNGQRLQSTSDFRFEYGLDYLLSFIELEAIGAKAQMYTKVPEAVKFLASTGTEVNCSIMAKGTGLDENGELIFSDITGMSWDDAQMLSQMYDNVQPILVAIGREHLIKAMANKVITMIIPYHASGSSEDRYRSMMESVGESVEERTDFAEFENEHEKADATPEQKLCRKLRVDILTGKFENGSLDAKEKAALKNNEILRQLYIRIYGKDENGNKAKPNKRYVENFDKDGNDSDCLSVYLTKEQAGVMMPYEYWDKQSTIKDADKQGEAYVKYCESLGITPVFSGWDSKGKYDADMDFTSYPGYWKTLIDRCMYNNDGTYHKQKAVSVNNVDLDMLDSNKMKDGIFKPMQVQNTEKTEQIAERSKEKIAEEEKSKYSLSEESSTRFSITEGMTEEERYNELKNETINIHPFEKKNMPESPNDLAKLQTQMKKNAMPILKNLASKLGITNFERPLTTKDLDIEFFYSNRKMDESASKQAMVKANDKYVLFAQMLTCFDQVIANARLIEVHEDRYKGTSREYSDFLRAHVLVSGFLNDDGIVPVKLLIKENIKDKNTLHVSIVLPKIKRTDQHGQADQSSHQSPLSVLLDYSLADLLSEVKRIDSDRLTGSGGEIIGKYIPEQFVDMGGKLSLSESSEAPTPKEYKSTIEKLEEQVSDLKSEFKRTDLKTADPKDVRIQAGRFLKRHDGNNSLHNEVVNAFNKIFGLYKEKGTDAFGEVYEIAQKTAVDVVNSISVIHDEGAEDYKAIKQYLKKTKIKISDEMKRNITDYNDFRKHNFGRLKLVNGETSNIDNVYMELMEKFPEQFTEDYVNPADQLYHIVDVLDNFAPYYENLDGASEEMQDYVVDIASDIMETAYGLQTKKTFADKKYLEKEKAVKKAREEALASRKKALNRQKERYEKKLEYIKQKKTEQRARKKDSEARTKLLNIARRLSKIKSTEEFDKIRDALIGQLDLEAKSMMGRTKMKLEDLQKWYEDQVENNDWFVRNEKLEEKFKRLNKTHIADMSLEDVENLTEILLMLEHKMRNDKKLINSQYQHDVFRAAVETNNGIKESKGLKFFGLHKIDDVFVGQTLSPVRYMRRLVGYDDNNPLMIATRELQEGQIKSLDYRMNALKPFNRFSDLKFVSYLNGRKAPEIEVNATTIDMKPTTVKIIPSIRIWFYLSSLNEDNMRHIVNGGVHIPDVKLLKAGKRTDAYDKGQLVRFSKSQVQAIIDGMTEQEKAYANQVYNYFNNVAPQATNEVSEQLDGITVAKVKNYLRISVDKNFLDVDADIIKRDGTLEGMGSHKERVKSSKPVYAEDISDVLMNAIEADSKYVGMAIPIRNFNKIYRSSSMEAARGEAEHKQITGAVDNSPAVTNGMPSVMGDEDSVKYKTLTGGYLSVQETIKKMWSSDAIRYIDEFISDLQFAQKPAGVVEKALRSLTSNYAGAVLTLNASVAIKQAASFPTAAAVVGWKPLIKSMGKLGKLDLDYVDSVTPLLNYRTEGFNFRETGDIQNRGNRDGFFQRATRAKALNWIQGMDVLTTRKLFKVAQIYVSDNFNIKKGSEAYDKKVAEVYNRIITETQPNYTTMERPGHLRSDSTLERTLSMFKTQPYQNFNIWYDATGNYLAKRSEYKKAKTEENRKALKEASKNLFNATTSQVVQLAVFAAMTSLWSLFRRKDDKYRDEDGNITFASYMKQLAKDMLSGASAEIFLGSEVFSAIDSHANGTYYTGFSSVTDSSINDILSSMTDTMTLVGKAFDRFTNGEEAETTTEDLLKQLEKVATESGRFTGIPSGNIRNLINAVYGWVAISADGKYVGTYEAQRMSFAKDAEMKANLFKAYRNDKTAYNKLRSMMIEDGFTEDSLDGYIKTQSKEHKTDSEQQAYDKSMKTLEGSSLWQDASAKDRDKYSNILSKLAVGIDDGETASYTKKMESGLSAETVILYKLALKKVDKPNSNGNMGTYTKDEKEAALRLLGSGLNSRQKDALTGN